MQAVLVRSYFLPTTATADGTCHVSSVKLSTRANRETKADINNDIYEQQRGTVANKNGNKLQQNTRYTIKIMKISATHLWLHRTLA